MLSEAFLAATSAPPKLTSSQSQQLKDAGIFLHTYQPQKKLDQILKKSVTRANGVAFSGTHIFAAQAEKATVHVYSREKGNQEATVPFPERVRSIVLALDDTLLVLGTEGGGLYLWETSTGRQISTSQSHLGPVTTLAVDCTSNFILSGSDDTHVHVWSLIDLITLPLHSDPADSGTKTPRHTLSGHRGPITSLVTGHSTTSIDIAVTCSGDNTAKLWNYKFNTLLRTIILPSTSLCATLDPGDRALYIGQTDGSVQLIDFFAPSTTSSGSIYPPTSTPLVPDPQLRMSTTSSQPSASTSSSTTPQDSTLSITLSYDTTTLLTGHSSGKILAWDIGRRAPSGVVAEYPSAPITNLRFLPVAGLPSDSRRAKPGTTTITKPRVNEPFSGPRGGVLSANYKINLQLPGLSGSQLRRLAPRRAKMEEDFLSALTGECFPDELVEESIRALQSHSHSLYSGGEAASNGPTPTTNGNGAGLDGNSDFVSLTSAAADAAASSEEEIKALKAQVAHLRAMQVTSLRQVEKLAKEKEGLKRRWEEEHDQRGERGANEEMGVDVDG